MKAKNQYAEQQKVQQWFFQDTNKNAWRFRGPTRICRELSIRQLRRVNWVIQDKQVYFLNEADFQYLCAGDYQSAPKLVKLFKSKSLWKNDNAIAEVRVSLDRASRLGGDLWRAIAIGRIWTN